MKEIDARGLECPKPVIMTKRELENISEGKVVVLVDNKIAVENLTKLASNLGLKVSHEKAEDNFSVTIEK